MSECMAATTRSAEYQCAECRETRALQTDGERTITIGCPTCGGPTTHARVWECSCDDCDRVTADPKWPKELDAPTQPHCNFCYGAILLDW